MIQPRDSRGSRGVLALSFRIIILVAVTVAGIWLVTYLVDILLRILIALILATGLNPLVKQFQRRRVPASVAVLIIYLFLLLALFGFGALVVPPVVDQTQDVIRSIPRYEQQMFVTIRDLQERFPFLSPLDQQLATGMQGFGGQFGMVLGQATQVLSVAASIGGGVLTAVLVLLIAFYFLIDGDHILGYLLSFLPPHRRIRARHIADRMGERMGGWLLGQIVLCLAIGVFCYIGLRIIGVPGAVALAVVAGFGEIVPMLGPIISAVPAIGLGLTQSPGHAVAVAVLYLVVQQLENNVLVPRIMGQALQLHPLAVIVSLLVGGALLGIVGAIVAIPVAAALAVLLEEFQRPDPPIELDTPTETIAI